MFSVCKKSSLNSIICFYLNKGGRRCGPAFVQNVFGKVFPQIFEERVTHMIQEVLVLGTVLLMTVDEAFDKPTVKEMDTKTLSMQSVPKSNRKIIETQ